MAKLLILVKSCLNLPGKSPQQLGLLPSEIMKTDSLLEQAANELYKLADEMKFAKLPLYDIPTSIDVLCTGKYRLPKVIHVCILICIYFIFKLKIP